MRRASDTAKQNGSLAVEGGRDIAPIVNTLLALTCFVVRIATKDWHPPDHVSFASNHAGKKPFVDFATITNPLNSSETYESRLWPDHCVQNTHGAQLVPELDVARVDTIIEKGTHPEVEMYSAFYDPLQHPRFYDSGLAAALRQKEVTHVYVVGLAWDYCVRATAIDSAKEGFKTYVVEEGSRAVDPAEWDKTRADLEAAGVEVVKMNGPEVARLK